MKNLKYSILVTFLNFLFLNSSVYSQGKRGGKGNHVNHGNHVNRSVNNKYNKNAPRIYKKRSIYRPKQFYNYRPIWAHHHNYNRRWIYFPRNNFYYDNWRQLYFYKTNNKWNMNKALPASFIILNLEDERHYELADDDDEMDRIYINNKSHFSLFDLNIIAK